jgi:hypothetical protein
MATLVTEGKLIWLILLGYIFCVKKGCRLKIEIRKAEDINKYRNTKINYRQENPPLMYKMFHDFIASSKSLMHGILCEKCCNSIGSIMIGFTACVQKVRPHN